MNLQNLVDLRGTGNLFSLLIQSLLCFFLVSPADGNFVTELVVVPQRLWVKSMERPKRSSGYSQSARNSGRCPPERRERHPWWRRRWLSGWRTRTGSCEWSSWCSGASCRDSNPTSVWHTMWHPISHGELRNWPLVLEFYSVTSIKPSLSLKWINWTREKV